MPRFPIPRQDCFDTSGNPRAGAKLYFYVTGTTTPLATYSNSGLTVANANPVVADSAGLFGEIFLTQSAVYKVVLKTSADVTVWTADPVSGGTTSTDLTGLVNAAAITNTVSEQQAITNKIQFLAAGAGAVTRSVRSKLRETVSATDFGVVADGVTDDTAAWNLALATGKVILFPEGSSVITGRLNMPAIEGAAIVGMGRDQCTFLISYATFDMATDAVIKFGAAYQGVSKVGFTFVQPSTAVRASVKQYPPVINVNGHSRGEISVLRIEAAYIGIRAQGNVGGLIIDDIQIGAFSQGLVIDGALDSVRINRYHFWPFGISGDADLFAVYSDGNTVSMDIGRCDDLNMSSILSFRGRMIFADHGSGVPFGVASDITLDSNYGRIEFGAGEMVMSNVYGSTAAADDFIISQTGGQLKINGLAIEAAIGLTTYAMVQISGASSVFIASNIMSTIVNVDTRAFRQEAGVMSLMNGYFDITSSLVRTLAQIEVVDGRASLIGLRSSDMGVGSGDFIKILNDNIHVVVNNAFSGWGYSLPAAQAIGVYNPNVGTATSHVGGFLAKHARTKKITGTLDGSGNVTVAHGIASAPASVVSAAAFYTGPSSEIVAIPAVTIDGTNVILAAGAGGVSKAYQVQITYT